jgi:hypothetical protein
VFWWVGRRWWGGQRRASCATTGSGGGGRDVACARASWFAVRRGGRANGGELERLSRMRNVGKPREIEPTITLLCCGLFGARTPPPCIFVPTT